MKKQISKNDRAKNIAGLRNLPKNAIPFDQPCELGYHCPICKYKDPKDNYDERLEWSEYEGFLWCRVCNKDYPSCLCMPDKDKAIDIYLDSLSDQKHSSYTQGVNETVEKVKEMIGEDEQNPNRFSYRKAYRNDLRSELRQQLETLKEE